MPFRISAPGDPSYVIYSQTGETCQVMEYAPAVDQYLCHLLEAGAKVWIPRKSLAQAEPGSPIVPTCAPAASNGGELELQGDAHLAPEEREQLLHAINGPQAKPHSSRPARAFMAVGWD